MKKTLVFGHIPIWFGGRQTSGLSNSIFLLAYNLAEFSNEISVSMLSTDIFKPYVKMGKLNVYGWTKKMLIFYVLSNITFSIKLLYSTSKLKPKELNLSILNLFLKRILLHKTISEDKPAVVHLHGVTACYFLDIIPGNIEVLVTMHHCLVNDNSVKNKNVYEKKEKEIYNSKRINTIVFIANQVKNEFNKHYGEIIPNSKVILQGFENDKYKFIDKINKENNNITLLTVGGITERKGQLRVVKALKSYSSVFSYICIGSGKEENINELKRAAIQNNISMDYLGVLSTEKVRETMASVDFMILPSIKEGFGIPYVESISCGVPVIAPKNTPLAHEGILNKQNSVLIENETVESIESCLSSLIKYNFDRQKVSLSLPNLSWENSAKKYEKLIESFQIS